MPHGNIVAVKPFLCATHTWEVAEDMHPVESKIKGVFIAFRFSVCCDRCEHRAVLKSSEICPYCFTTMGNHTVDTEVRRFKAHPDANLDPFHYAKIHRCPTCDFRCVSFVYDR